MSQSRQDALETLNRTWREDEYKRGIYTGGNEAFASMVIYGEVTICGRRVRVSFDWPDEEFASLVRDISQKLLEQAHAEGRQVEPPESTATTEQWRSQGAGEHPG